MELPVIQDKIYEIRGQRVMLDFDLAELYGVATKVFNQAVKRNINRFPEDFMFRLSPEEWEDMRSQVVTGSEERSSENSEIIDIQPIEEEASASDIVFSSSDPDNLYSQNIDNELDERRSQFVTASGNARFRNKGTLPYAFTEHGVTMLASVLRSEKAVNMSITVVRAFIALKQYAGKRNDLSGQLQEIRDRLGEHDVQLNSIYDAIENLLDEKAEQKAWQERERIGFRK